MTTRRFCARPAAVSFGATGRSSRLADADRVHLVQRNLVLLVQVLLHRFGAREAELHVERLRARGVGVALDLQVHVLRILLELVDELVEPHPVPPRAARPASSRRGPAPR